MKRRATRAPAAVGYAGRERRGEEWARPHPKFVLWSGAMLSQRGRVKECAEDLVLLASRRGAATCTHPLPLKIQIWKIYDKNKQKDKGKLTDLQVNGDKFHTFFLKDYFK